MNVISYEVQFDPVYNRDYMMEHPMIPIAAVVLYGILILIGQRYFATRDRWDWRRSMAIWNFGLSLFSCIGFIRTAPKLLHNLTHYTIEENVCFDPESHFGSGSTGLWVQWFILSKFPELIDTFFIVIHKKPLILLHWYHHISVLLYCWHSYVTKSPTGILFCVMNYAVHAIMYFYYATMAARIKFSALKPIYITAAQISQMVVGVAATLYGSYVLWVRRPAHCWLTLENNSAALVMYGSYLVLFLEFFWQRYRIRGAAKTTNGVARNGTATVPGRVPPRRIKKED
jgi:elongation of very long chain fatty acids protein 6